MASLKKRAQFIPESDRPGPERPGSRGPSAGLIWLTVGLVIVLLGVVWAAVNAPGGPDLVTWTQDVAAARTQAAATGKPVLLNFTADWCDACQYMKSTIYAEPALARRVNDAVVPVKVDMTSPDTEQRNMASQYHIEYLPTLVLTDAEGRELGRTGAVSGPQLMAWLQTLHPTQTADR